ncbi:Uncharacterised protein [Salmonella enterica subsp. enterica serovar Typhi]|nr:Uncharacterised protein [Salmonella enterica subsp. enterica serovar Typhi]
MVRIFIVPLCGIHGDTRRIFFRETDFGIALIRVHLNRERLRGAQYFKQKRQFAETVGYRFAQHGGFILFDGVTQGDGFAVGGGDSRAAFGMRAHPEFSHWLLLRIGDAIKFR